MKEYEVGINGHISKPIDTFELVKTLNEVISADEIER